MQSNHGRYGNAQEVQYNLCMKPELSFRLFHMREIEFFQFWSVFIVLLKMYCNTDFLCILTQKQTYLPCILTEKQTCPGKITRFLFFFGTNYIIFAFTLKFVISYLLWLKIISMRQTFSWETTSFSASQEIFRVLFISKCHYRVDRSQPLMLNWTKFLYCP